MSVISAEQFKNKATRVVAISGFEEGEKIEVRIRPVSLTAMMMQGRISNELKSVAFNLFEKGQKGETSTPDSAEDMSMMYELIDQVCENCLVEPKFEDIKEFMTDGQKIEVFTASQGVVKDLIPSNKE